MFLSSSLPIAWTRWVLPRPGPPYRKNGLYLVPGELMMLRAAATANSLFEPIIKLSKVYFELRPLLSGFVWLLELLDLLIRFSIGSLMLISRGRILGLVVDITSNSKSFTVILLFLRALVIINILYVLHSILNHIVIFIKQN